MIVQEPHGAVTNAVCALASLHNTRAQSFGTGQEPALSKCFYDEALFQLENRRHLHGQYSESDAIAALQLVSYSLFSGGVTSWQTALATACDWLAQTGIVNDDNPKLTMLNMSLAGRFAVKVTMVSLAPLCRALNSKIFRASGWISSPVLRRAILPNTLPFTGDFLPVSTASGQDITMTTLTFER